MSAAGPSEPMISSRYSWPTGRSGSSKTISPVVASWVAAARSCRRSVPACASGRFPVRSSSPAGHSVDVGADRRGIPKRGHIRLTDVAAELETVRSDHADWQVAQRLRSIREPPTPNSDCGQLNGLGCQERYGLLDLADQIPVVGFLLNCGECWHGK